MEFSKDMKMNNPNEVNDFWTNVLEFGKVAAPWATVGVGIHTITNKVFKYFSDSRDRELQAIVKLETDKLERKWMERAEHLEAKIDNLTRIILEKK